MKKTTVFLHIGMHKTGTTAVQMFCAKHEQRLRELGVLYPRAGRPVLPGIAFGHHLLPWSLTGHVDDSYWPHDLHARRDAVWERLTSEIEQSGCSKVILSSEELDTLNADQIGEVIRRLSAFDLKPIAYLRRLDELAQAMYTTEVVHSALAQPFEEFVTCMRTPLDYAAILAPWGTPPSSPPTIRYYKPDLIAAGVLPDFLATVGLATNQFEGVQPKERVNVGGWPWYVIEVCRRMNVCGIPSEQVVKFAYIMSDVAGRVERYDISPPSLARELANKGVESLERLKASFPVPDVPSYFRQPELLDPRRWEREHAGGEHRALTMVLQQLSRVTKPS